MSDKAIVCGVEIGTFEEWDQLDTFSYVMYGFQSSAQFEIACPKAAKCDLVVDYEKGIFAASADDGSNIWEASIVKTLHLMLPT